MNALNKDLEDIYDELDSLNNFNPANYTQYFIDLSQQHQQQSCYEPLPPENDDIQNYKPAPEETHQKAQFSDMIEALMRFTLSLQQPVKCTRCKVKKTLADFGLRKNGERMKICRRCTTVRRIGVIMTMYKKEKMNSLEN